MIHFLFYITVLNIRSMNKKFESFKEFYLTINFKFSIVCFSETWVDYISFSKNSNFQISIYKVVKEEEFVFLCAKVLALNLEKT